MNCVNEIWRNDFSLSIEALLDETTRAYFLHKDLFDEISSTATPKEQKSAVWTPNPTSKPLTSRVFSVSSVLTFMLAVGLAHFVVVVGGLSGSRGYAKLEAVQAWVTSTVFSK